MHRVEKSDTKKYYLAYGGETEWTPAVPEVEQVDEVEATYDEDGLELTPYIPEVEYQEEIPAKAPRLHIGVLDPGLTLHSGQPNLFVSDNISDLLEASDPVDLSGHNELPKMGEQVDVGLYTFGDSLLVCRQAHIRTEHNPRDVPALFSFYRDSAEGLEWMEMEKVEVGETRTFGTTEGTEENEPVALVYEVIQAHTTQKGWEPDKTPALWQLVEESGGDVEEWVQPTGAHDTYTTGDEVMFEGTHYRSLIDNNSWSPSVYPQGWEELYDDPT